MRATLFILIGLFGIAPLCGSHTLAVPFFADDGGNMGANGPASGNASFIGIKNISSTPILLDITYIFPVAGQASVVQNPRKFLLGGSQGISWRPFRDDPSEGSGRVVPGVLPGNPAFGSAIISWQGGEYDGKTVTGRFVQFGGGKVFAHAVSN